MAVDVHELGFEDDQDSKGKDDLAVGETRAEPRKPCRCFGPCFDHGSCREKSSKKKKEEKEVVSARRKRGKERERTSLT